MKTGKWMLLGLSVLIMTASCRKADVIDQPAEQPAVAAGTEKATGSDWSVLNNWQSGTVKNSSFQSNKISDARITGEIVNEGLVLVYKKQDNAIVALPYQDWFYHISQNSIVITHSGNELSQMKTGNSFIYFVISPDQLNELSKSGYSKEKLMQLSYESVAALLK